MLHSIVITPVTRRAFDVSAPYRHAVVVVCSLTHVGDDFEGGLVVAPHHAAVYIVERYAVIPGPDTGPCRPPR
jgi:hypothetical protein